MVQHTNLEDIGLMKMLPGMTVINRLQPNKAATLALLIIMAQLTCVLDVQLCLTLCLQMHFVMEKQLLRKELM
jgi:hypothetical protein